MKLLICLFIATSLSAQDGSPKAGEAAASQPTAKVDRKVPSERHQGRVEELDRRQAQADKLAEDARHQKKRTLMERDRQARYKKAEAQELRMAEKARQASEEAHRRAEAHRKKAEEFRRKAEESWKAYQATLKPAGTLKPKPAPVIDATKEKELPKEEVKTDEVSPK